MHTLISKSAYIARCGSSEGCPRTDGLTEFPRTASSYSCGRMKEPLQTRNGKDDVDLAWVPHWD